MLMKTIDILIFVVVIDWSNSYALLSFARPFLYPAIFRLDRPVWSTGSNRLAVSRCDSIICSTFAHSCPVTFSNFTIACVFVTTNFTFKLCAKPPSSAFFSAFSRLLFTQQPTLNGQIRKKYIQVHASCVDTFSFFFSFVVAFSHAFVHVCFRQIRLISLQSVVQIPFSVSFCWIISTSTTATTTNGDSPNSYLFILFLKTLHKFSPILLPIHYSVRMSNFYFACSSGLDIFSLPFCCNTAITTAAALPFVDEEDDDATLSHNRLKCFDQHGVPFNTLLLGNRNLNVCLSRLDYLLKLSTMSFFPFFGWFGLQLGFNFHSRYACPFVCCRIHLLLLKSAISYHSTQSTQSSLPPFFLAVRLSGCPLP